MQRKAAAVYLAFFIVMGAGAYSVMALAETPDVEVPGPKIQENSTFTLDGEQFRVTDLSADRSGVGASFSGKIIHVNESFQFVITLQNNSTVPPTNLSADLPSIFSETFQNQSTIRFNGSQHTAIIPNNETPTTVILRGSGNNSTTIKVGDTLRYRGNVTTLVRVQPDSFTLVGGNPFRVLIPNASSPSQFTLRQEFNVSSLLRTDPAVENETVTREDGNRYVVFEANGTTRPLEEYLPTPATITFSEGETLRFGGNATTVANVTQSAVKLTYEAPKTVTNSISEGTNVTLSNTTFTVHFVSDDAIVLTQDFGAYQEAVDRVDFFHMRMNGLWIVIILSGIATVLVGTLAFLPTRG